MYRERLQDPFLLVRNRRETETRLLSFRDKAQGQGFGFSTSHHSLPVAGQTQADRGRRLPQTVPEADLPSCLTNLSVPNAF